MSSIKLADGIYSVGVMNPALRIFDIIMYAEFGTSYNAYLVKGEKTALIDTVHHSFFDEYLENLSELTDVSKIDYLIMNHTEPDHSGSIAKLVKINPEIKIFCSAGAKKYLEGITNLTLNSTAVKQGDSLDLGGRVLTFIPAPFLHWPDSMFTYDGSTKTIFTCDFFGAHYCEPRMLDIYCHYPEKYNKAFEYYYTAIFGPFKPYVLSGLDKIKDLKIDRICPSHGAVLTEKIAEYTEKYRKWSTPRPNREKPLIMVAFASAYGYTGKMAEAAHKVLSENGYDSRLVDIVTTDLPSAAELINECDAFLIGSDTINRDATKPVWDLLSSIDAINTRKPVGAFGSYGWSGEAVPMIKSRLEFLKFNFTGEGVKIVFNPTDEDLQAIRAYALEVASNIK